MTDKELIRKVHNGNKEALEMVIGRYYDEIYRFCFFLTGAQIDSYDITQELFLKFIRHVDTYQDKNLKGYLLTIARNCCHDYFRHKKDMVALEDIEIAGRDGAGREGIGKEDAGMTAVEDGMTLRWALMRISKEQREVIVLRIYEELKFREIVKMLGVNLSTVKSRYYLGIQNLKAQLLQAEDNRFKRKGSGD